MVKLSDYISNYLSEHGVTDVFMISGGGAMHLVDSIGCNKDINYICPHHEQAAAIAAEGYSRVTGKIGVVVVTSGPGGTNTITGVIGQWLDSIPCLYISGQVKKETTIESCKNIGLRQLGDQEINIIDIVKPITKYAAIVSDPNDIKYHLEKAVYMATHGRPGPVWLDIPLDVQAAVIDENKLKRFNEKINLKLLVGKQLKGKVAQVVMLIKKAKSPVIVAGHGIRISGSQELFFKIASKLGIPLLSTFNGFDLIPSDHDLFIGRIGTVGDRAGNYALQNADLVLFVGTRNNIRQISYNWKNYTKSAVKIVVDIDPAELKKPTIKPDLPINADAKEFLKELDIQLQKEKLSNYKQWVKWCVERKNKYPVALPEYAKLKRNVQPYYFIQELTKNLGKNNIVVAGNGTACVALFQAGIVKAGERMFWNSGCASMGYDLPAAIGACFGSDKKKEVICLAGDGSLQMNMQELQTMFYHKLPLKLFVLNNRGYISIKQTQDAFFGRRVACCEETGVSCPDIVKVASSFGLKTARITSHKNINNKIRNILATKGPVICEVVLAPDYKFMPKLSSRKTSDGKLVSCPLEDMFPFLTREEHASNMIVKE